MKKKLALYSTLLILCSLIVGGTFAYFFDNDDTKNTFEFGSVKIEQFEQERDDKGNLVDFTQGQYLYPIVNVTHPRDDIHYKEKLVSVKNIGSNEAYVRTFIAVPYALKDILHLDIDTSGKWLADNHKWNSVSIDGISYYVTSYTYSSSITKNETTEYVLNGIYLDSAVDLQQNADVNEKQFCTSVNGIYKFYDYDVNNEINVYVVTQGCQVKGLSDNPTNALDTAFGTETPTFN